MSNHSKKITNNISFPHSIRNVKIDLNPGPGNYDAHSNFVKYSSASTKFSKTQKSFALTDHNKSEVYVGPGEYEAKSTFSAKGVK